MYPLLRLKNYQDFAKFTSPSFPIAFYVVQASWSIKIWGLKKKTMKEIKSQRKFEERNLLYQQRILKLENWFQISEFVEDEI